MSRKFVFATAFAVCLALAFAPVFASRSTDRSADRSERATTERGSQAEAHDFQQVTAPVQPARATAANSTLSKAQALVAQAMKEDGTAAISTLNQVFSLDLPDTLEAEKVLAGAYARMGDLYAGTPQKQVQFYGLALQYAGDPGQRGRLETKMNGLGGSVFDLAARPNNNTSASVRDAGPDDTCDGAVPYPGSPITMSITPSGDANFVSFTVAGPNGDFMRIETISDTPGTYDDDTDLTLWGGCVGGVAESQLAFNDDSALANAPFMSRIDTGCLLPGTYYVEVGGFFDIATPDNFDLLIESTGTCELPPIDGFEGDDTPADAADIGFSTSIPTQANGWGRAHKEIQSHTIFPLGDIDHQRIHLNRSEIVRMGTALQFPTKFNGFTASAGEDNPDTILSVLYGTEPNYGGRCNQPDLGFPTVCFSDADCDGLIGPDALPGFPDCVPIQLFNGGVISSTVPNPLAVNDDRGFPDYGSELMLCLPKETVSDAFNNNRDWITRVNPYSVGDFFAYQVQVRNEVQCRFEDEIGGNDWLLGAVPDAGAYENLTLGETVHGIYDFAATNPYADSDVFAFDVDSEKLVSLRTDGYDTLAVDTYLELFVGPDDAGGFYYTGVFDEDGGDGYLSTIEVILPPASDLLGNTTADANYYLQVTSRYFNPNYPYTLITSAQEAPMVATEGDGTCDGEGAANPIGLGDTYAAAIDPACDYDAYKMTLSTATFVSVGTTGSGDTALQLEDCDTGDVLACDDDSGPGLLSLVEGCLPAGNYCVRVRAYSSVATFGYGIEVNGAEGCIPGAISGDGAYTCLDYDSCP